MNFSNYINTLIHGNFLIALCASSLAYFNSLLFNLGLDGDFFILVFCITQSTYSLQRIFGLQYSKSKQLSPVELWLANNFNFSLLVSITSLITACYLLFTKYSSSLWLLAITSLIAISYAIPIEGLKPLRQYTYLKSFIIALNWSVVTFIIPFLNSPYYAEISANYFHISLGAFATLFFVFAQCLPFDIRDLEWDKTNGIVTIPQKIGINNSKTLAIIGLLLSIFFAFILNINNDNWSFFIIWVIANLYILLLIAFTNKNRKEYYYSLWLELGLMLPFSLIFLIN